MIVKIDPKLSKLMDLLLVHFGDDELQHLLPEAMLLLPLCGPKIEHTKIFIDPTCGGCLPHP